MENQLKKGGLLSLGIGVVSTGIAMLVDHENIWISIIGVVVILIGMGFIQLREEVKTNILKPKKKKKAKSTNETTDKTTPTQPK